MNNSNIKEELPTRENNEYYRVLTDYLDDHRFPKETWTSEIVYANSENAAQAFEDAGRQGYPVFGCNEFANKALFEKIGDSEYETIEDILGREFRDTFNVEDAPGYWEKTVLEACPNLFDGFRIEGGLGLDPDLLDTKRKVIVDRIVEYCNSIGFTYYPVDEI